MTHEGYCNIAIYLFDSLKSTKRNITKVHQAMTLVDVPLFSSVYMKYDYYLNVINLFYYLTLFIYEKRELTLFSLM